MPFLEKYIPGNPKIVMEFMPGGGSRKAANYVFGTAKPDGLTMGNLSGGMVSLAVLGEAGILYDLDKFYYLGSPYSTYHAVLVSRKEAGLDTIEKLRAASGLKIGAQSVGFRPFSRREYSPIFSGLKIPASLPAIPVSSSIRRCCAVRSTCALTARTPSCKEIRTG